MKKIFTTVLLLIFSAGIAVAQVPNPQIPLTGTAGAAGNFPLLNSGTFSIPSDADFTPTFPNTTCIVCKVTSGVTLTATRNLIEPAASMTFNITNATTGGQSIIVKAVSGTGVTIANGTSKWVWFDGTNYVEIDPPAGGSGCAEGTCIQNNPVGSQSITQPVNTAFNTSVHNWPVTGGGFSGFDEACLFDTYTGFTGGSSVQGSTFCKEMDATFTATGWMYTGTQVNGASGTANQTAHKIAVTDNSMGVGGGIEIDSNKYSNQENNGISITLKTTGNALDANAEGATPIQATVITRGSGTSTVATSGGGSGATTITTTGFPTDNNIPIVGPSRIALDTATPITTTQTSVTAGGPLGVLQATLGTSVTASVCGAVAGGALITITSYQITSNLVTFQATNTLWNGEPITINMTSSTFLNGSYTAAFVSGSTFAIGFTHANTGVVTEAGTAFTVNVDTPLAANNGTTNMTFGITLGSAYVGSTTAKFTAFEGLGIPEVSQLVSVGSYTGGVQYVTAPLMRPIQVPGEVCIGGSLQGYYITNTSANAGIGNGFYNLVVGTGSSNIAYEIATLAGRVNGSGVYAGNVTLYPGGEIHTLSGNVMTISPQVAAWANADPIVFPEGITSLVNIMNGSFHNDNAFAVPQGEISGYFGPALLNGGTLHTEQGQEDKTQLISNGGWGAAPFVDVIQGHTAGRIWDAPPSDGILLGTQRVAALDNVQCANGPCMSTYYRFYDSNDGTGVLGWEKYTQATGIFNYGADGGSATLEENGKTLCKTDGTNCPAFGTGTVTTSGTPTIGVLPLFTGSTIIGNSLLDYGVTTASKFTFGAGVNINDGTGVGGGFDGTEGTAHTGASSVDALWADATSHRLKMNNNNTGAFLIPGLSAAGTSAHCVQFAANGIDLADAGAACGTGGSAFSAITAGTNTTAAMVVGSGASLAVSGSGAIGATTLLGNTWAAPGNIGFTTPGAGNFASVTQAPVGTATSGGNFNSATDQFNASVWNGTVAITDTWQLQNTPGAGTNPTSTLAFAHTGSSGAAKVSIPAIIISGQTGSTQCATFDTNGNLTGVGAPCGTSGSGITGGTTGFLPLFGSATTITGSSPLNYGITTASTVTDTALTNVNLTGGALSAMPANTVFAVANVSASATRIASSSFGATSFFSVLRADGTAASPTQVLATEQIGGINAWAFNNASAYNGPVASLRYFADENQTATAAGSRMDFITTPDGSTTAVSRMSIEADGGVIITGLTPGTGAICANGTGGRLVNSGCAGGSGVTSVTGTANQIASTGGTTPVLSLPAAITLPGTFTNPTAGAASTPGTTISGAPFTGGSGTTTYPLFYFDTTGSSQPTTLNTAGSFIGINAPSGFAGFYLDFHLNGAASVFNVAQNGATVMATLSNVASSFSVATTGKVISTQFVAGGATPTQAAGAAAGTLPTCSTAPTGAPSAGVISCTTGTAPTTGTLLTITTAVWSAVPQGCTIMARNAAASAAVASVHTTINSVTNWSIIADIPLILSTTYQWSYQCM